MSNTPFYHNLLIVLLGLFFALNSSLNLWYLIIGIAIIVLSFLITNRKILSFLKIGSVFFLFSEIILQIFISMSWLHSDKSLEVKNGIFFNKPSSKYDITSGYKWAPNDTVRTLMISNGELVYDNYFKTNNLGYVSNINFRKEKNGKRRYLVFGDSFSDAIFLENSWVNHVNEKLKNIELYNYSLYGSGLDNWYKIFMNEIKNKVDFDGVIFAIAENDLDRNTFYMHQELPITYAGETINDFSNIQELKKHAIKKNNIYDDSILDDKIELSKENTYTFKNFRLQFLPFIHKSIFSIKESLEFLSYQKKFTNTDTHKYSRKTFITRYGEHKWNKLNEMVSYLTMKNKKVILTYLPNEYMLNYYKINGITLSHKEGYFLSNELNFDFYDSFNAFKDINEEEYSEYFLIYDYHWNQKGSDKFANAFCEYLKKEHLH